MRLALLVGNSRLYRSLPLISLAYARQERTFFQPSPVTLDSFVETLQSNGISRVALVRHGKTSPAPEGGTDFDRVLTTEGRQQASNAGAAYGVELKPYFVPVLVSPSPRTIETADLFFAAAGTASDISYASPRPLYDGVMQPKGSALFRKIGYAPLRDYLECEDEEDRMAARDVLGSYARTVTQLMLDTVQQATTCDVDVAASSNAKAANNTSTLCFIGHAIYLPSVALQVATLAGCDKQSLDLILTTNTKEAEGYLVDFADKKVTHLIRTLV
jgi:Histidine phosphatase superfamily (branch 1)